MPDSYATWWKEPYRQALKESDEQKLTKLVQAAEYAIVLRLQEVEKSTDHHGERIEMERAAADLLVIKTYKLGWPAVPTSGVSADPMYTESLTNVVADTVIKPSS